MTDIRRIDAEKLNADMTTVADAIRAKGGTSEPLTWPDGFASAVDAISAGGAASVEMKDINFYDYDGTRLYSYTLDEFAAMTELPPLPSHDGLICQEWNWTLEDIKAEGKETDVGATYITDDGATRLYIEIATLDRMDVPLYFQQTVANGVTIDWGDGSAKETVAGTGSVNAIHTYANIGEYKISLMPTDDCVLALGNGVNKSNVMGAYNKLTVYPTMLKRVEVGKCVESISDYAFSSFYSLASVTLSNSVTNIGIRAFADDCNITSLILPNGLKNIGTNIFIECIRLISVIFPYGITDILSIFSYCKAIRRFTIPSSVTKYSETFLSCYSLESIILPYGVTSFTNGTFNGCRSMASVTLPNSIKNLDSNAFSNCCSLTSITLPNSVTKIDGAAFSNCYSMKFYDFTSHTSVPGLGSTYVFQNIPVDCEIRVPAALYDEWIAATNWSTYADNIVAV